MVTMRQIKLVTPLRKIFPLGVLVVTVLLACIAVFDLLARVSHKNCRDADSNVVLRDDRGDENTAPFRPLEMANDVGGGGGILHDMLGQLVHQEPPRKAAVVQEGTEVVSFSLAYRREWYSKHHSSLFAQDSEGRCQGTACKWPKMPGATRDLVMSAPELFETIPLHFLSNFKNPCWLRNGTELSCLPYFYIVGTCKCGTTDVWDKLVAHPEVVNVPKEPHWWGPRRNGYKELTMHRQEILRIREVTGGKGDGSLEWYLNLYKLTGAPALINYTVLTEEGAVYHPKVFGDASISTSYTMSMRWTTVFPRVPEPPSTNADLIGALQPNAKIIFTMRDPTKRAKSWYWYAFGARFNATDLHEYVKSYIACFKQCVEEHNLRYCAYASKCPKRHSLLPNLEAGIYHVFLRDWFDAYSRDRVHVIRLEDWHSDQSTSFKKLLRFLDLSELSQEEMEKILGRPDKNRQRHRLEWEETDKLLNEFYAPYNAELARLMGDEKYHYK